MGVEIWTSRPKIKYLMFLEKEIYTSFVAPEQICAETSAMIYKFLDEFFITFRYVSSLVIDESHNRIVNK